MSAQKTSIVCFSLLCLILAKCESKIITVDFVEDIQTHGFHFDHVESSKYFDYETEVFGVWSPSQPSQKSGVWVFSSNGIGGCCGGRWDLIPTTPLYNATDYALLQITYFSNVDLFITPTIGKEIKSVVPPSPGSPINWSTVVVRLDASLRMFRILAEFGTDRHGYLLLDKILIAVNEQLP